MMIDFVKQQLECSSISELSRKTGVNKASLSKHKNRIRPLTINELWRILQTLPMNEIQNTILFYAIDFVEIMSFGSQGKEELMLPYTQITNWRDFPAIVVEFSGNHVKKSYYKNFKGKYPPTRFIINTLRGIATKDTIISIIYNMLSLYFQERMEENAE